jgi:hypothetical protein
LLANPPEQSREIETALKGQAMSVPKRFRMRTVLLFLAAGAVAWAADVPTRFIRLDLMDGRTLTNVVIKSYDAATGKLLLVTDGKAMLVPADLIPPPLAARLKAGVPAAGSTTAIVTPQPAALSAVPEKPVSAPAVQVIDTPGADPMLASHQGAAEERAQRYYRYEFQAGSNAISITALDIDADQPEAIMGWPGRYRTKGKAYLEFYDSRGNSFSRTTSSFEVITEQKPGQMPKVVDFTRL